MDVRLATPEWNWRGLYLTKQISLIRPLTEHFNELRNQVAISSKTYDA